MLTSVVNGNGQRVVITIMVSDWRLNTAGASADFELRLTRNGSCQLQQMTNSQPHCYRLGDSSESLGKAARAHVTRRAQQSCVVAKKKIRDIMCRQV